MRTIPVVLLACAATYVAELSDAGAGWYDRLRFLSVVIFVPLAIAAGMVAFRGSRVALARAGRYVRDRARPAAIAVAIVVVAVCAVLLVGRSWVLLIAWFLLMATPEVAFTLLDGGGVGEFLARLAVGVLALAPGLLAAYGAFHAAAVMLGWLADYTVPVALLAATIAGHLVVCTLATSVRSGAPRRDTA